jgi:hypothetical protein
MKRLLLLSSDPTSGLKRELITSPDFPDYISSGKCTYQRSLEVGWIHWDFILDESGALVGFSVYDSDIDDSVQSIRATGKLCNDGRIEFFFGSDFGSDLRKYKINNEQAFGSQVYISTDGGTALALLEWGNEFDNLKK